MFNIHLYSEEEVKNVKFGLNQQRLRFWNEKAVEICSDKTITNELDNNREAIEGAIHSSWTLHKTGLLELQVEELEDKAKVYDEVAREYLLRNVRKNLDRMQTSHATISALSDMIAESSDMTQKVQLEKQLSQEMSELKRAQDALSKAIQRSSMAKDAVMT